MAEFELSLELLVRRLILEKVQPMSNRGHDLHADSVNLRHIGQQRGFPARLRRKIWMLLLNIDEPLCKLKARESLEHPHIEEEQVVLDVNRAFTTALPDSLNIASISAHKTELKHLILRILRRYQWLHYYQGYHDIAQVIHLVMGNAAEAGLEKLTLLYLRDFMLSSLEPSMSMLRLVHQIVRVADPEYAEILLAIEPFYAISTLLTWWAHSLQTYSLACRVFDFLLSSEVNMIIYTIAAATLYKRKEVIASRQEADMMFLVLNRGVPDDDMEGILQQALQLSVSIRPAQLSGWRTISKHSCLKTNCTSMIENERGAKNFILEAETELHHKAQEAEVKQERMQKQLSIESIRPKNGRWSVIALSFGILAVGMAWYIQQQGGLL